MILAALLGATRVWWDRPIAVPIETVALAPVTRVLAINGRIAAVRSVDLRASVAGTLQAVRVAEGDLVEAGQVLARVDAAAQNAIVRQAMAGLDAALVAQQQARESFERATALGANVARSTLDADAYALQSAQQEVARLTAALEQARSELDKYTIRAPFAGSIVALEAEPGQIVGPSVPLLTLADLGALVVEADVDETYATRIAVDQPAILQLTGETATREGRVRFVSRKVDATNGALAIKLGFDAPATAPLGLTVAVNIIVDSRAAALTVPRSALTVGAQGTGVFLLADGLAQYRPIAVVDWPATRLIVTEGLTEGEVVITQAEGIEDGQTVLIEMP